MTDFYALLKQSIIERDIRDPEDREAVYTQARQAIVKQLWAFHPPLAADEIDTRVGAYDQAVERIERDLRAAFDDGDIPVREKPVRRLPPLAPPKPEPEADSEADREDEIAAPPLAEWHSDGEEGSGDDAPEEYAPDEYPPDEHAPDDEVTYERGVPRAEARDEWRRPTGRKGSPGYADEARRDEPDERARPRYREAADVRDEDAGGDHDRWRDDGIESARGWWPSFDERATILILTGAIAALFIALVGLVAFYFFAMDAGADAGAGAPVGAEVRRVVSDSATAARIAGDTLEVVQGYSLFDGRDPTIFATTPDNPVRFVSEGGYARVGSSASTPGVKAIIGPGLAARLAGNRVRVTLVARSSADYGAVSMRFAYQSGLAISHWQTASLSSEYQAVGMIWRVPTMRTDPAGDYLVIEPGIPGDGTGVDIQSIRIEVLAAES